MGADNSARLCPHRALSPDSSLQGAPRVEPFERRRRGGSLLKGQQSKGETISYEQHESGKVGADALTDGRRGCEL